MGTVFTNQMTASRQFEGDGARDEFPFDFDVFDSGDVTISLDGETVETGFHVTLGRSGTGAGSAAARGAARGGAASSNLKPHRHRVFGSILRGPCGCAA